jgi:hypothetical protein
MRYKRGQVEEAICRTLSAEGARAVELKLRLKRLLVTDRRAGRSGRGYAFYSQQPPGSGVEVLFLDYEAFALLVALSLLEHGMPQTTVVRIMRELRGDLEAAYRDTLKKDPKELFDLQAVRAMARPGMLAVDNTDPVFLALVRVPGRSVGKGKVGALLAVCRGPEGLAKFLEKHAAPGLVVTVSELVRLMFGLATNLSQTRPIKRGRSML